MASLLISVSGYKIYPYQRKSKTIYRLSNLRAFNVPVLNIVSLMTFHPDILQGFVIKPKFRFKSSKKDFIYTNSA